MISHFNSCGHVKLHQSLQVVECFINIFSCPNNLEQFTTPGAIPDVWEGRTSTSGYHTGGRGAGTCWSGTLQVVPL